MLGTAVSRLVVATATAAALVATLGACSRLSPNSSASPEPSVSESVTPSETATASATATPSASPSTSPGALGALTGTWKGTWLNEAPQTAAGTFTLSWAQQGDKLFGAIGVVGSTCVSGGNVTGSVTGDRISFGAVEGNNTITYLGTVSGNTMSGTYTSVCGNSKGTWSAVKA